MADTTDESILYIRGLPQKLKADFKAFCAKHEVSMTEKIAEMMLAAIKEKKDEVHRHPNSA